MESTQKNMLTKTFLWMFLGLLGTGIVAVYTYSSGLYLNLCTSSASIGIIAIVEVLIVLLFTFLFKKLPPTVVAIMFFLYAAINGITFSTIFAVYELSSIIYTFFITAGMFGVLAFVGSVLNIDVSKFGPILIIGILTAFVASLVNLIFFQNGMAEAVISAIIILIFCGFTVYDISIMKYYSNDSSIPDEKKHIYFAMQLYLDFINLFIRLLRIIGKAKD